MFKKANITNGGGGGTTYPTKPTPPPPPPPRRYDLPMTNCDIPMPPVKPPKGDCILTNKEIRDAIADLFISNGLKINEAKSILEECRHDLDGIRVSRD